MHCAFALMIGGTGVLVCRHWWSKAFWALWPLLIAWVVIVTANHYWVDAALGWMVAATSALVASRLLARARPEAWSWRVARRARPRRSLPRPPRPTSLTANGTFGAPEGPRRPPQRPPGPQRRRSFAPTPATA